MLNIGKSRAKNQSLGTDSESDPARPGEFLASLNSSQSARYVIKLSSLKIVLQL